MFNVISGEPPFVGLNASAVIEKVRDGKTDFSLLNGSTLAICQKAMALLPVNRYESVEVFAQEFRKL